MTDISKLPKWAQEHVAILQRQRDTAVQSLKDWNDTQTPSPISVSEHACIESGSPTYMKRYIEGHRVEIEWLGVRLFIVLRDEAIDLQWSSASRGLGRCLYDATQLPTGVPNTERENAMTDDTPEMRAAGYLGAAMDRAAALIPSDRFNATGTNGRNCPICYRPGALRETGGLLECLGCFTTFRDVGAGTLERVRPARPVDEPRCPGCGRMGFSLACPNCDLHNQPGAGR